MIRSAIVPVLARYIFSPLYGGELRARPEPMLEKTATAVQA
jgi:hypothetical protein